MKKKKILSILLAAALCVGLAVPAMAAQLSYKNPKTLALSVPEAPALVFTVENICDEYLFGTERFTAYYEVPPHALYIFAMAPGATISCNKDMGLAYTADVVKDGSVSQKNGHLSLTGGDKLALYSSGQGRPDGEYIVSITITIGGTTSPDPVAKLVFDASNLQSYADCSVNATAGLLSGVRPVPPAVEAPSPWAAELVDAAVKAGLVPSALQSSYTQATTRAEFCALSVALYQAATGRDIQITASFVDTTDENVLKMASVGVVSGIGNNKFAPDQKLTREQAATMLARLAEAVGKPLPDQAATFADVASISTWAVGAVGQVQGANIMGGVGDNTFAPQNAYTREQSMITMLRLFDAVK